MEKKNSNSKKKIKPVFLAAIIVVGCGGQHDWRNLCVKYGQ